MTRKDAPDPALSSHSGMASSSQALSGPSPYAAGMQRLFSMFPDGWAGVALAILRACAGGSLLVVGSIHGLFATLGWTEIGVGTVLLLLGAGALTPIACIIAALIEALTLSDSVGVDLWQAALGMMTSLALALLGPGAFSLDAKLFGRRLIVPKRD